MNQAELPPLLLLGAGKMGAALFAGWAARGLAPSVVVDPSAPETVARPCDHLLRSHADLPAGFAPGVVVLAIKPQMAGQVLPDLGPKLAPNALVISILAGPSAARIAQLLGTANPVVRAMPNTPAAIGQGMTVAFAGPGVSHAQRGLAHALLSASGALAWLDDEALIDPVTSVSGSGPAYVFLLAELMEQAGIAQGLPPDLARLLARKTVSGAGALLDASTEDSGQLRRNVTSPNGVTERALAVLMESWPEVIERALRAAAERSREMGRVFF